MRQFQMMPLVPHPQTGPFYDEHIFEHLKCLLLLIRTQMCVNSLLLVFLDYFSNIVRFVIGGKVEANVARPMSSTSGWVHVVVKFYQL